MFMKNSKIIELWINTEEDTSRDTIKPPLDQTHFDCQQNRIMHSILI